jgi:hypothetical protein
MCFKQYLMRVYLYSLILQGLISIPRFYFVVFYRGDWGEPTGKIHFSCLSVRAQRQFV